MIKKFVVWFCGYENDEENNNKDVINGNECVENLGSLKRTVQEKFLLRVALITVVTLDLCIFVYFSIPLKLRPI